ncbi:hypothetical protein PR048_027251 [Dryococelus australis]|uniref:Uncharacterized protein n=1 Tax=Dryococelus australis TaxID=614101 RepID=A0ABQ9GEX9_9NEOP|nr:hypothetical protein PR048_027251 [Dryococelus australis]
MPKLPGNFRKSPLFLRSHGHTSQDRLADPMYNVPGKVDILLGGDTYPWLLISGRCIGVSGSPVAIETDLGGILSRSIYTSSIPAVTSLHVQCDDVT